MTGGYGLDGKVAIVTGSGRHAGLGAAMAARLGAEGCRVVVCDLGQVEGELFPEHGVGTTAEMEEVASGTSGRSRAWSPVRWRSSAASTCS
jgi:meso-butanediol dehydrogenase/(S,S)-butanediol dehydrogenase/diacetyl reductase